MSGDKQIAGNGNFPACAGPVDRNGKITFNLYAPGKKSVHLTGDFNDWKPDADPMREQNGLWSVEKELSRGAFAYQFVIDGELAICDPCARYFEKEPGDGPQKAIVKPRQEGYEWKHDGWARPYFSDLVICEMHIADFTPQRDFREAVQRLDYMRGIGVNAIQLMPVFGIHENKGWGYTPTFLFAVNEDFGTPDELRWFIDEAHGRGMAVILDMVLAHTGHNHPFNRMYSYENSPWYGTGPAGGNEYGLPQLDYSKPAAREFVKSVLEYWLNEFRVDGFRFDYIKSIGVTPDGYGIPTLSWAARSARKDAYLIGEHLPEDPALMLSSGMDGAWHVRFSYALKALLCENEMHGYSWDDFEKAAGTLDPAREGYGERPGAMVNYLESHDEERVMFELKQAGFDEETARRKSALGAAILFTAAGVPMLYHGQTFGQDTPRNMDHDYISWEALEQPGGRGLEEHYRKLARLRRENGALKSPHIAIDAVFPEQKTIVYHRWDEAGGEVIVAANFSSGQQHIDMPVPSPGKWKEFFSEEEFLFDRQAGIDIDPTAVKIFLRV